MKKGSIRVGGKDIPFEVVKGITYINGMTIEDYMDTCTRSELWDLAEIGRAAMAGNKKSKDLSDTLHQIRNN